MHKTEGGQHPRVSALSPIRTAFGHDMQFVSQFPSNSGWSSTQIPLPPPLAVPLYNIKSLVGLSCKVLR